MISLFARVRRQVLRVPMTADEVDRVGALLATRQRVNAELDSISAAVCARAGAQPQGVRLDLKRKEWLLSPDRVRSRP